MAEIVPTILTSDINEFTKKINLVSNAVPRVQIDIVDGKFAPKKTIDLEGMRDLADMGNLRLDLHLMVDKPEDWINRAIELLPDRIIGQIEMMTDPKEFIDRVVKGGAETGLALDLETPVGSLSDEYYHMVDLILILSVKAGWGGQEFDQRTLRKIEEIKKIVGDLVKVGVDGGLTETNIKLCKDKGADIFYVGGSFWSAENLVLRYNQLSRVISN